MPSYALSGEWAAVLDYLDTRTKRLNRSVIAATLATQNTCIHNRCRLAIISAVAFALLPDKGPQTMQLPVITGGLPRGDLVRGSLTHL